MLNKLKITRIATKEMVSPRTNKPYTSMSIQTQEYGERWLGGFKNKGNENWKVGDGLLKKSK